MQSNVVMFQILKRMMQRDFFYQAQSRLRFYILEMFIQRNELLYLIDISSEEFFSNW